VIGSTEMEAVEPQEFSMPATSDDAFWPIA
jgi:hypothetical protein